MFAVIGRELFSTVDPKRFGSLAKALITLFQLITLDDWFYMYTDIINVDPGILTLYSQISLIQVYNVGQKCCIIHSAPKVEVILRFHVKIWLLGGGIGVTTISVQNSRQVGPLDATPLWTLPYFRRLWLCDNLSGTLHCPGELHFHEVSKTYFEMSVF
jgi:hypothetical protein